MTNEIPLHKIETDKLQADDKTSNQDSQENRKVDSISTEGDNGKREAQKMLAGKSAGSHSNYIRTRLCYCDKSNCLFIIRMFCAFFVFIISVFKRDCRALLQVDRKTEGQLGDVPNTFSSTVLPTNKTVCGRVSYIGNTEKRQDNFIKPKRGAEKEGSIMPIFVLSSQHYQTFSFQVSGRQPKIWFLVEASSAVSVYVLDDIGLVNFESDNDFCCFGGYHRRTKQSGHIVLPMEGFWYLVIHNETDKDVAVRYELEYA